MVARGLAGNGTNVDQLKAKIVQLQEEGKLTKQDVVELLLALENHIKHGGHHGHHGRHSGGY